MVARRQSLFSLYIYIENFKNLLVITHWTDIFQYNLIGLFLWWPSTKFVQAVMIRQKTWPLGMGFFPQYIYIENFKKLLVRNHETDLNISLQKCTVGKPLPRQFKPLWFVKIKNKKKKKKKTHTHTHTKKKQTKNNNKKTTKKKKTKKKQKNNNKKQKTKKKKKKQQQKTKNRTAKGQGLFPLYIYIETFKNLYLRNHWTDFSITWQKCSLGDPLPRMFKPSWYMKKNMAARGEAYFPYISLKSPPHEPMDWFQYNLAGMFLWWSSTKVIQVELIFPIYLYRTLYKSSRHKPLDQFQYNLAGMFLWWPCTKIAQAVNKAWQKCVLGDPLPRLFKQLWFVKKHGC